MPTRDRLLEDIPLSPLTVRDIATALEHHAKQPLLGLDEAVEKFRGLKLETQGKVSLIDTMGSGMGYVTVCISVDGLHVQCNFRKPLPTEVAVLKNGAVIKVAGVVYHATPGTIVLDQCQLRPLDTATAATQNTHQNTNNHSWHTTWWGYTLITLAVTVIGGLAVLWLWRHL
jgi:hypothetical protein